MTKEELIDMATQAGARQMVSCLTAPKGPITAIKFDLDNGSLERFAKLVRNYYSYTHAHLWLTRIEGAVKAERGDIIDLVAMYGGPVDLEAAIRARGQA